MQAKECQIDTSVQQNTDYSDIPIGMTYCQDPSFDVERRY